MFNIGKIEEILSLHRTYYINILLNVVHFHIFIVSGVNKMNFESIDLTIKSFDDINLHYKKDFIENPKAIILISHGLAEHSGRYDYTSRKLNDFGYSVYRYDHRGHGLSDGRRGYIKHIDDLFEDANTFVDFVRLENPNVPIFMLGHNLGGHILTGFGCKYESKVDGMIFCSSLICDSNGYTNTECDSLDPFTLVRESNVHNLTHDLEAIHSYENDNLVLEYITQGMYKALKESCISLQNHICSYSYPCLIIHSCTDSIISCDDSKYLFDNISSDDKEIILLSGLYHKLLDEIIKDEILSKISNWIDARVKK